MKANKFIEQFGLKRAEEVLQKADDGAIMYVIDFDYYAAGITTEDYVLLSELKRFVENHITLNKIKTNKPKGATSYFMTSASQEVQYVKELSQEHAMVWADFGEWKPLPDYFYRGLQLDNRLKPL